MEFIEPLPANWGEYLVTAIGSISAGGLGFFGTKKLIDKKQDAAIYDLKKKNAKITNDVLALKRVNTELQKKVNAMDKSLGLLKKDVEINTAFDKEHRAQVAKEYNEMKESFKEMTKYIKDLTFHLLDSKNVKSS